ncbi:MAG TPA: hypothetical protein VEX13_07450, partial [Chloroflexia bacterium]|nr:hypothetical protein [Chloroflexia bacterium]
MSTTSVTVQGLRRPLSAVAALLLALGVLIGLALVGLTAGGIALAGAPSGSVSGSTNGSAATATPGCPSAPWVVVANPRLNVQAGLQDVVAVSPTSAWAIGNYTNGGESRGLIEQWDGVRWNIVPGQSNFAGYYLVAVDALSDSDIWVAGQANGSLILHWDGVSWTRVPSPNTGFTYLTDIDALSTNDVWAVGYYSDGSTGHNLTMHWDGAQWTIIPAPEPFSAHHYLYSVSGTSSTDVWAVGEASQNQKSVAIHWDGQQWSHVPTPLVGRGGNTLFTVAAISPNDAWAMGHAQYGPTAVILHWDGKSWNPATTPEVLGAPRSMAVISADDIWAVGTNGYQGGGARIAHWDGVVWRSVPTPSNLMDATLFEVSGTPGGPVWAVGDHSLNPGDQPLTLRYEHKPCGAPTRTHTPTSVATPAPPICGIESNYEIEHGTGTSIVPGVILVPGSQCDDCLASVNLPFTYYLYGQPHDTAQVGSNGVLNFTGNQNDPFNECAPDPGSDAAIFPFWDNLDTSASVNPTYGVYTSLNGLAPNRIFNIEWRSCRWREGACNAFVNFEVRLYEGQNKFDVIYGSSGDVHGTASAGVQRDGEGTLYTNYYCAISHIPPGTRLTYFQPICNTPTPSVTGTPPTATPTHTAIPTGTRTPTQTPTITPTVTSGCGLLWRQVSVPDPGSVENALYGLAAISSQEMWAVGTYRTGSSAYQALLMRWSGDAWTHYPSPSSRNNVLRGVPSLSPTDAWAVGYSYLSTGPAQTLIKHWDGAAWTNIPSPSPGEASALYGVTAIATNNVWAVGYQQINSRHQTLILRWNGQQWTTVASPNPGSGGNDLNGISAISSSDIWAVGSYAQTGSFEGTLTLHWNGSQWTHVPSPNLVQSPLYAV